MNDSTESLAQPVFLPTEQNFRSSVHVVVLKDRRRPNYLNKDMVGTSLSDLSARYNNGSLYQDVSTRQVLYTEARATIVGSWELVSKPKSETESNKLPRATGNRELPDAE